MPAALAQPHTPVEEVSFEEIPFEEILSGYNNPGLSLDSLAAAHELTLRQLLDIVNSEAFLTFLADLEQANARRFAHIHAVAALNTLADVATSTAPPTERRRAATPILHYLSRFNAPRFRAPTCDPPVPPNVGPPTLGAPSDVTRPAPQPSTVNSGATGQPFSAGPCPSRPSARDSSVRLIAAPNDRCPSIPPSPPTPESSPSPARQRPSASPSSCTPPAPLCEHFCPSPANPSPTTQLAAAAGSTLPLRHSATSPLSSSSWP